MTKALPPGQYASDAFPRFGLLAFASRRPDARVALALRIGGDVESSVDLRREDLDAFPRTEQVSDLHCVTTWSKLALRWGGYRFRDLYEQLIVPRVRPKPGVAYVLFKGLDGFRSSLPLDDAIGPDVLLADRLENQPLSADHGAPLRVVAPDHYGYKSAKHLCEIRLLLERPRGSGGRKQHSRGRVALEERADVGLLPGWIFRWLYRPTIPVATWYFERAAARMKRRRR